MEGSPKLWAEGGPYWREGAEGDPRVEREGKERKDKKKKQKRSCPSGSKMSLKS